jgi:2-phosphosulfolactate phosphatase
VIPDYALQTGYGVRCAWGAHGVAALVGGCDVVVVIDVLSFTTSVELCVSRGATVCPLRLRDERAAERAAEVGAVLAGANDRGWSLKPHTLEDIEPGTRIVLPSPNGSRMSTLTGDTPTLAGCLRNASAVAVRAAATGRTIGIVASGEEWPDGSLRPAFEDQCGAGAVIAALPPTLSRSPEARAAEAVFRDARDDLHARVLECASGREKQSRGYERDVELATQLDVSSSVPELVEGTYRGTSP